LALASAARHPAQVHVGGAQIEVYFIGELQSVDVQRNLWHIVAKIGASVHQHIEARAIIAQASHARKPRQYLTIALFDAIFVLR
jgi:hypothetical protein